MKTARIWLLLLPLLLFCTCAKAEPPAQGITVEFSDLTRAAYIIDWQSLGPHRLDYAENKEVLDAFFTALAGEYQYVKNYGDTGTDGGGPYSMELYGVKGELLYRVRYFRNNGAPLLAIEAGEQGSFFLYEPADRTVSYESYWTLVKEQGVFQK